MKKFPFLQNGIAQIAILVPDLEKTVRNFYDRYGIGPWSFYTYERPLIKNMTYHGKEANYSMRIALANVGMLRIELIQPKGGESIYKDFIKKHGYGLHHIGIVIENMDEAIRDARQMGLEVMMDGSGFGQEGDGHYSYLDTEDELGVILELIERPHKRSLPEKIYPPE